MQPEVIIDCFPESARKYGRGSVVVAIDVIRATTSAITAVVAGHRCITVPTLEALHEAAQHLERPLLVGELHGDVPDGFDLNNSPVDIASGNDTDRPMLLLSTSGTKLIHEARHADSVMLASFRNFKTTAHHLAAHRVNGGCQRVALIGAGSRGEFREEDQMCCAWIADILLGEGFIANEETERLADLWRGVGPEGCRVSNSAKYLLRTGQDKDLEFVIAHTSDLDAVYFSRDGEIFEERSALLKTRPSRTLAASVPEVAFGIN